MNEGECPQAWILIQNSRQEVPFAFNFDKRTELFLLFMLILCYLVLCYSHLNEMPLFFFFFKLSMMIGEKRVELVEIFCVLVCVNFVLDLSRMMERADSGQKLYSRMRIWEFPDEYVIEPTDGSSAASLSINRHDGSLNLIGMLVS